MGQAFPEYVNIAEFRCIKPAASYQQEGQQDSGKD
jgi:hypothetical protein